jgi:tRNA threonylcarbamoyladenosine biosynthesis protein TsaE
MQKKFITKNAKQTQELGKLLSAEIKEGKILALQGELGAGKTNFAQGLLAGLGAKGPYTSPTFVIMKYYKIKAKNRNLKILNVYHVDAYRINSKDVLNLGWEEIMADKKNVIIIEWADRIKKVIPSRALWIKFEWIAESERKITFKANN